MISDEEIRFMLGIVAKRKEAGKDPDFRDIQGKITGKYATHYSVDMLQRAYEVYKNDPRYKPLETTDEEYIDTTGV